MPYLTGRPVDHLKAATSLKLFVLPDGGPIKILETDGEFGEFTFYCEEINLEKKDKHDIAIISSEIIGNDVTRKCKEDLDIISFIDIITDKTVVVTRDIDDDDRKILIPSEAKFENKEKILHLYKGIDIFSCDTLEYNIEEM